MPRPKGTGKGLADRVTIRFDEVTSAFYRRKANEAGMSVAEYCRQLLVRGIINDNVQVLEQRIQALLSVNSSHQAGSRSGPVRPELLEAVFFCKEVLTAIISDRNIQHFYDAQDRAKLEVKKLQEAQHG
ncbi:hypothetical protein KEX41_29720 (plasmid) [Burkholderia thailandensis]|jgi:hypothetical protein|uniref:hypothetical protein n=1 Tax=Burkholderia thailandensis TaxID=57975 RepID=UPI00192D483C|nr:hypothetical protein [Burkholderia thailandensis]MBS2132363.1 hypothetical protein [Burkholderia thailandensis]QRA15168.1 hypothetical protein JMY07_30145 [Burkholderia thailandensis]